MLSRPTFSLKGSHFESVEDIQSNVITVLKGLSENDSQQISQAWQRCWNVFIKSEGDHNQ